MVCSHCVMLVGSNTIRKRGSCWDWIRGSQTRRRNEQACIEVTSLERSWKCDLWVWEVRWCCRDRENWWASWERKSKRRYCWWRFLVDLFTLSLVVLSADAVVPQFLEKNYWKLRGNLKFLTKFVMLVLEKFRFILLMFNC